LKGSSQCGVATENNSGLWWLMVAVDDGESAWDIINGFGRKKEEEMVFFLSYTKAKAENAQMRNALGNGNFAHTPDIFSKIPTVRLCKIVF